MKQLFSKPLIARYTHTSFLSVCDIYCEVYGIDRELEILLVRYFDPCCNYWAKSWVSYNYVTKLPNDTI